MLLNASSTRGKFEAPSNAVFFNGSAPAIVGCLDGGTEGEDCRFPYFKCFDDETVSQRGTPVERRYDHDMLMARKQDMGLCVFSVSANQQQYWAPLSLNCHHHRDNNTFECLQTFPRVHNSSLRCTAMFFPEPERRFDRSHHPRSKGWAVRRHRNKIVDRLHLFQKLGIVVLFAKQFLGPTVHERGFAKW